MKIYACIKRVPDTAASIRITGAASYDPDIKTIINPYDEYAIEQALRVREQAGGGEVVLVTLGPAAAASTLRGALAMGADRAILILCDDPFPGSRLTGRALARAIQQDGTPELIFTGRQAIDTEGMQVPFRLAAALDLPVANDVVSFEMSGRQLRVGRDLGAGEREILTLTTPCVLGVTRGLNEPRHAKLPEVLKAKKKEIRQIELAELGIAPPPDACQLVNLENMPDRGPATMIQGQPEEMARRLVGILKERLNLWRNRAESMGARS